MTKHYTAVLEIQAVTEAVPPKIDSYGKTTDPGKPRETSEVVRLVVRAQTLAALRDKLGAHIALIEES